jgi:hypothetical protein
MSPGSSEAAVVIMPVATARLWTPHSERCDQKKRPLAQLPSL